MSDPLISSFVSLPQLNNINQSIDTENKKARRQSKAKSAHREIGENLRKYSLAANSVYRNSDDYNDVSRVRSQINRYKDSISKTKILSKPMNYVDTFYNLGAYSINGKYIGFNSLSECVLLVVNVATCDPKTTDEFRQLNEVVNQFSTKGFAVLAFLCNQFTNSQPWDNDEVMRSLKFVRPGGKYEPNFPIFATCDVNGSNVSQIFDFLKLRQPFPFDDMVTLAISNESMVTSKEPSSYENVLAKYFYPSVNWSPVQRSDIGGNFEKFLIDRSGQVVSRYTRKKPISLIIQEIEQLASKRIRENKPNISQELASLGNTQANNIL